MKDQILLFLNSQKENIICNWSNSLESDYPGFYDLQSLREQGLIYFQLLIETEIPVEVHPIMKQLPYWCNLLINKNIPLDHTLRSSQYFRKAVIDSFQFSPFGSLESSVIISTLIGRIDAFERAVCKFFWQNARSLIEEKDKQLEETHEDKLNLIGKMAASMAHEIRNPLTSIKGFMKLIRTKLSEESLKNVGNYLEVIEGEFENINMQITGFLSFSKKPVIEEQLVTISLKHIIDSVLVLITPRLTNENIHWVVDGNQDLMVRVQKIAIQHALSNLLNNSLDALYAVNHLKRLTILILDDSEHIVLKVINNGPEIPKNIQKILFKPFVTSKTDGTGIGLAICKQIMDKNNGTITFTSTEKETSFILTFNK